MKVVVVEESLPVQRPLVRRLLASRLDAADEFFDKAHDIDELFASLQLMARAAAPSQLQPWLHPPSDVEESASLGESRSRSHMGDADMQEDSWIAEFSAKPLPSGMFAPLVKLSRSAGEGSRETSLTFTGVYSTPDGAIDAARRHYTASES